MILVVELPKNVHENYDIPKNLSKDLNTMRESGKYCDFAIKSEDGQLFQVHKCVLESVSKVFKALFNSENEWADSKDKKEFLVKGIIAENLSKVINYMYTGKIEVSDDNIRNILDGSSFLGLDKLVEFCLNYLCKNVVNDENCFDLWNYAESYANLGNELKNTCILRIMKNAENVLKSKEFLEKICYEKLRALIGFDEKRCEEKLLITAIIDWLNYDYENRKNHINDLLKEIRFENINNELFSSILMKKDSPLFKSEIFMEKILNVFHNNIQFQVKRGYGKKSVKMSDDYDESTSKIDRYEIDENLFAVISRQITQFNSIKNKFTKTITEIPNFDHTACTVFNDKNLFTYSYDQDPDNCNVSFYSFHAKLWMQLPDLIIPLIWCRATSFDNNIYLCGLSSSEHSFRLKVLNIETEIWSNTSLQYGVLPNYGFSNLNRTLFIMNGVQNIQFDPRSNEKIQLESCDNLIESIQGYNNCIYGFSDGGINIFDIRANKWLDTVKSYTTNFSNVPHSCIHDGNLILLGNIEFKTYALQIIPVSDLNSSENIVMYSNRPILKVFYM